MSFTLFPAIDVKSGRAVRLYQGELSQTTEFGEPLTIAQQFIEEGASWIHLVDLDAAFGHGNNFELISQIAALTGVSVEISGGIRDDKSLQAALATGCARVNIGTAAIENPQWVAAVIKQYREKIAISIDVRGYTVATKGWTESAGDIFDLITQFDEAQCSRYVVTDIERDGTLTGPNVELLRAITQRTSSRIVASGGVASLADLQSLSALAGIEGAIIGKALYTGSFTLSEAIASVS